MLISTNEYENADLTNCGSKVAVVEMTRSLINNIWKMKNNQEVGNFVSGCDFRYSLAFVFFYLLACLL